MKILAYADKQGRVIPVKPEPTVLAIAVDGHVYVNKEAKAKTYALAEAKEQEILYQLCAKQSFAVLEQHYRNHHQEVIL